MSPRAALPVALALLAAAPAIAQPWRCALTVQCPAGEGCASISQNIQIMPADHAGDLFLTGFGTDLPVARLSPQADHPHHYAGRGRGDAALLITIEADTRAVLSLHDSAAPTAATSYFGTCEELT